MTVLKNGVVLMTICAEWLRNEKNEIVGYDIDLAKEACKRAGMEVEFKPIDWASKEAEIKGKRIDAIWNCFTVNPERQEAIRSPSLYGKCSAGSCS